MGYLMPWASSVITAKGVTSDPVPDVVGMATMIAFFPREGNRQTLFRMSMNRMASWLNFTSGFS